MSEPIKLTVVMTHPIQYYAPWFRHVSARRSELDLTVLYAAEPTPEQQGVGFGQHFTWDIALTEGYRSKALRSASSKVSLRSDDFWGVRAPEISAAILESKPDVALIAGWHSAALARALLACRRHRVPVLYRGDTHLGNRPEGLSRAAWEARTWLLLRLFSGYLSVGKRARDYLNHFGVPGSKIFNSPHCVDNDFFAAAAARFQSAEGRAIARASFGLNENDFVVLFAGKLEAKKRPLDLIRAAARLNPQAKLLIVGAGAMENACREQAQKLNVKVLWAGFLNQSEMGRAYAAADCLALPSDWGETWGLVVNEALATGLPCVVSDRVGCAPDLITPNETGEVFSMGDVAGFVEAIARIRKGPISSRSSACRKRAAAYSFDAAATGLLAACLAVTGRRGQQSDYQYAAQE